MSIRANALRFAGIACASSLFGIETQVYAIALEEMLTNSFS